MNELLVSKVVYQWTSAVFPHKRPAPLSLSSKLNSIQWKSVGEGCVLLYQQGDRLFLNKGQDMKTLEPQELFHLLATCELSPLLYNVGKLWHCEPEHSKQALTLFLNSFNVFILYLDAVWVSQRQRNLSGSHPGFNLHALGLYVPLFLTLRTH